ncbi:helix-turn-helix domain-containing protein [Blautia pseudococcoides]|nr:helix-turn-helix domain-containing protein [Blautia pseudococcoides]QQQ95566.1 helix-turn-helix domain-containing protein [Blautia pseudococcoides]
MRTQHPVSLLFQNSFYHITDGNIIFYNCNIFHKTLPRFLPPYTLTHIVTIGRPLCYRLFLLTSIRLEHAYTDLLTTDYSVFYITEKNGFANYQMFVQKFKQIFHNTPLKIRKLKKRQ